MKPKLAWVILRHFVNNIVFGADYVVNHDIADIRNQAPMCNLILSADEPYVISPGVYVFSGYNITDKLVKRYKGFKLGNDIKIEPY